MQYDIFRGYKAYIDFRIDCRDEYETRVVSKQYLLDIGGRNQTSKSRTRIKHLSRNPNQVIVSTDIIAEYGPDLVDDITRTSIAPESFDGIYCDAILEHVIMYWDAIDNIYTILKSGGEAFIYVPFCYPLHDLMDYHRFTFPEVARMLNRFSEVKVFLPGKASGFGFVFWSVLTFKIIDRFQGFHNVLAEITNVLLKLAARLVYKQNIYGYTFEEFSFYWIYLYMNHGFAAWVRK
jgi:hypothetical protein